MNDMNLLGNELEYLTICALDWQNIMENLKISHRNRILFLLFTGALTPYRTVLLFTNKHLIEISSRLLP